MAIQDIKWDILGISEMRREGENIHEYQDYILFNKGEKGGKRGVGFLIKMSLKKQIQSIFAYAPTEQAAESEIESFYADLAKAIRNYTNNHIILMGDFNAQIGEKQYEEEYVLGKHGLGFGGWWIRNIKIIREV
ncbi:craniofacial development protein 2-like [Bombyx mori]|uniref:craniofacial development protein 2-like n=1 Tax=Bombyx mori TaxID=7091 RepID=UPI002ED1C4E6